MSRFRREMTIPKSHDWTVVGRSRYLVIGAHGDDKKRVNICQVFNDRGGPLEADCKENAHLISGAPDLLEACYIVLNSIEMDKDDPVRRIVEDAIFKSERR